MRLYALAFLLAGAAGAPAPATDHVLKPHALKNKAHKHPHASKPESARLNHVAPAAKTKHVPNPPSHHPAAKLQAAGAGSTTLATCPSSDLYQSLALAAKGTAASKYLGGHNPYAVPVTGPAVNAEQIARQGLQYVRGNSSLQLFVWSVLLLMGLLLLIWGHKFVKATVFFVTGLFIAFLTFCVFTAALPYIPGSVANDFAHCWLPVVLGLIMGLIVGGLFAFCCLDASLTVAGGLVGFVGVAVLSVLIVDSAPTMTGNTGFLVAMLVLALIAVVGCGYLARKFVKFVLAVVIVVMGAFSTTLAVRGLANSCLSQPFPSYAFFIVLGVLLSGAGYYHFKRVQGEKKEEKEDPMLVSS